MLVCFHTYLLAVLANSLSNLTIWLETWSQRRPSTVQGRRLSRKTEICYCADLKGSAIVLFHEFNTDKNMENITGGIETYSIFLLVYAD